MMEIISNFLTSEKNNNRTQVYNLAEIVAIINCSKAMLNLPPRTCLSRIACPELACPGGFGGLSGLSGFGWFLPPSLPNYRREGGNTNNTNKFNGIIIAVFYQYGQNSER